MKEERTYTYPIKPFQQTILEEIRTLKPIIYNYVINQKLDRPNLTMKQLKRCVYRSIRLFIQDYLGIEYRKGIEDKYVKYYCFFETSKEFHLNQNDINSFETDVPMGIHFHLFISPISTSISMNNYTHYLYEELTSFPHKKTSINDFGYRTYSSLSTDFVLYHTKQWKNRYEPELVMKNF